MPVRGRPLNFSKVPGASLTHFVLVCPAAEGIGEARIGGLEEEEDSVRAGGGWGLLKPDTNC